MEALITHPELVTQAQGLSASWFLNDSAIVVQLGAQDVKVITEGTRPTGRSTTDRWSAGPDVTELIRGGREWLWNDWHTALAPRLCVSKIINDVVVWSQDECQKWVMTSWKFGFFDRKQ